MMRRAEHVHSQTFCRQVQCFVQSQSVGHAVSFLSPRSATLQRSSRMRATSCSLTCPWRLHACADMPRCCPPVHRGAAALALLRSEATKWWPQGHRSAGRAWCTSCLMIFVSRALQTRVTAACSRQPSSTTKRASSVVPPCYRNSPW